MPLIRTTYTDISRNFVRICGWFRLLQNSTATHVDSAIAQTIEEKDHRKCEGNSSNLFPSYDYDVQNEPNIICPFGVVRETMTHIHSIVSTKTFLRRLNSPWGVYRIFSSLQINWNSLKTRHKSLEFILLQWAMLHLAKIELFPLRFYLLSIPLGYISKEKRNLLLVRSYGAQFVVWPKIDWIRSYL